MIKIINIKDDTLDLSKIDQWYISWGGSFSDSKVKNNIVKIPGGKFLDFGSESETSDFSLELIANTFDIDFVRATVSKIQRFCSNERGLPERIWIKKSYEPGTRLSKLSDISYDIGTKTSKISISFTIMSHTMVALEPNTINESSISVVYGTPKVSFFKTLSSTDIQNGAKELSYIGCDFMITLNPQGVEGLKLISVDEYGVKRTLDIGKLNDGHLSITSSRYEIRNHTNAVYAHFPLDFKFYKEMYFEGTKGTLKDVKFAYWSEWL